MQESMPPATEIPPPEVGTAGPPMAGDGPLSDARALQILSTEHWSLLATRSLSYNEAFSRAAMFLTFLSASLIVIGFLVGNASLSDQVVPIALILLAADFFIGLATVGRLIDANFEELQCIRGMNRIRYAYREMVPGLDAYFVTGFHDDGRGILITYFNTTMPPGTLANIVHGLTTTVGMIAAIDAMLLGAIAGLGAIGLGSTLPVAVVSAIGGFLVGFAIFTAVLMRTALARQRQWPARFPTPDDPSGGVAASSGGAADRP